jgi:hypothetical protein
VLIFTKNKTNKWFKLIKNKTNKRNKVNLFFFGYRKSDIQQQKNLLMKKIINNFTEIKDNTPPRLAAMQHTWGGSFYKKKTSLITVSKI